MTDYENEQEGLYGKDSVSWTCDRCGSGLHSPADFELVDGDNVCRECLDSSETTEQED